MRFLNASAAVLLLALPAEAMAQTRGHRTPPQPPAPAAPIGLPQLGLPLPQVTPQLPRMGLALINTGHGYIRPFHDGEFFGAPTARVRNYGAGYGTGFRQRVGSTAFVGMPIVVYAVPQYVTPFAVAASAPPAQLQIETQAITGSLVLQVQPPNAQLFVDGYYVGMPEDFDGVRGELQLEPGPHKIELIAPGYQNATFNVRIAANQIVRYEHAMKPAAAAPPPSPAPPIVPKTIYLIPGCYLGDVPPKDAHLPATCDVTRVVTFSR